MAREDLEFANDAHAMVDRTVTPAAGWMLFFIGLGLAGGLLWASQARVEQSTRSLGTIIPSSQVQVVESLEPGIVAELLVRAGDKVVAGQDLIRMDDTGFSSSLGELLQKERALAAELLRLEAQAAGAETFDPPASDDPGEAQFLADQKAVFEVTRLAQINQRQVRAQQVGQKRFALTEAEVSRKRKEVSLSFTQRELDLTRKLFQRNAVPEMELVRIERTSADLEGEIRVLDASMPRLQAEIAEIEALSESDERTFLAETQARIAAVKADLSVTRESIRAAQDRVNRTVLRSPVNGIVNSISVATVGEVIAAGTQIVEIVPLDDALLVQAQVRPEDIAFIRPGLKAVVRLSAYDYRRFGYITGTVQRIGADTITDEKKETFYQVIIGQTPQDVASNPPDVQLIPGMVATVDILAGERTVLDYILGPIVKIRDFAFREPR